MKRITFLLQSERSHAILLLPSAASYVHLKTRINEIHWRQEKSDTKQKRFRRMARRFQTQHLISRRVINTGAISRCLIRRWKKAKYIFNVFYYTGH